ncbi:MAG: hypothetical protein OEW48_12405 [Phycisphaerae bacterium]|nr:hypothetical protein [Phycisphaerae bacterium]
MSTYNRYFIPKWYYYATPLFILLDYFAGINVRVSALDSMPFYKYAYYGFCILCALCIYISPRYSPIVALFESTINVIMMALLLFIPYVLLFSDTEDMLSTDSPVAQMFTPQRIVNLGFAGFVAVFAFRASINKLAADFAPTHSHAD